ncbi:MAG: hypothetical protein J5I93_10335 [Pirellulaceae bacterium]|nr:hypothetical protein [Pirellulaceae bacterium]
MNDQQITQVAFVREEPVEADLLMVFGASNETDMQPRKLDAVWHLSLGS